MAKNIERQRSLDRKKWVQSEKQGKDLSGARDYCECCKYQINTCYAIGCSASQEEREAKSLCAKAYNRMIYLANKK